MRVIDCYRATWHKAHVLLVGYSYRADVLPFMVNQLPEHTRQSIVRIALLGLGVDIDFEIHVSNWLPSWLSLGDKGRPLAPSIRRLSPGLAVCLYGIDDSDAICLELNPSRVRSIALPGGIIPMVTTKKLMQLILSSLPSAARSIPARQPHR